MPSITQGVSRAVPVRDMKDTAKFCQTVRESDGPVVVTRRGYDEFFVLSPAMFREYQIICRKQEIYERIDAAELRLESGQGVPAHDALDQIRQRHGL